MNLGQTSIHRGELGSDISGCKMAVWSGFAQTGTFYMNLGQTSVSHDLHVASASCAAFSNPYRPG